jgi:transcriptional regulator with XRE-family HTH domain
MAHPLSVKLDNAGITQAELARRSGVPQSTISRVLRGADGRRTVFTPEAAKKIAAVVRVRMADLLIPQE